MVLTFALPGFTPLLISRVLLGVGSGIFNVCAFTIVAELAPPGRQARSLANLAMGLSSALVFGVPLARVVANAYDWRAIFWATGLLSLLSIFAVARSLPPIKEEEVAPVPLSKQLALLKEPKISGALGISFFMFISYSIVSTYITPFLTTAMAMDEGGISTILFGLGIASLVGAKLGGFMSDKMGVARTLASGMAVQAIALVLISLFSSSALLSTPLLMVWSIGAWTCGPMLGLNLVSLAPEAAGILLSLNGTFIMLGFAGGAAIGGIALTSLPVIAITWIGAATVAFAVVAFVLIYKYARSRR
jgi:DHA1 family putative efflux transporter-like MFS transporter